MALKENVLQDDVQQESRVNSCSCRSVDNYDENARTTTTTLLQVVQFMSCRKCCEQFTTKAFNGECDAYVVLPTSLARNAIFKVLSISHRVQPQEDLRIIFPMTDVTTLPRM